MNVQDSLAITRPKYGVVSVAAALEFHWSGYHLSEKMDGCWHELKIGRSVIVGEIMRDDSFWAFDLPVFDGVDYRRRPTSERLACLRDQFPSLRRPSEPEPGESPAQFLQRILAAGGEGMVAKALDSPFGSKTFKVKRFETFDCVVSEKHPSKKSLHLILDGQEAGWCACVNSSFRKIKAGDVVEVGCMVRHASGKLREPRFIRCRPDK